MDRVLIRVIGEDAGGREAHRYCETTTQGLYETSIAVFPVQVLDDWHQPALSSSPLKWRCWCRANDHKELPSAVEDDRRMTIEHVFLDCNAASPQSIDSVPSRNDP